MNTNKLALEHCAKVVQMTVIKTKRTFGKDVNTKRNIRVAIPVDESVQVVDMQDMNRLEAADNYTHVHLVGGLHILASKSLKTVSARLPRTQFIRVHQSHVINHLHISQMTRMEEIKMSDGGRALISRSKKSLIKDCISTCRLF